MKYFITILTLLTLHFSSSARSLPIKISGNGDFLKDGDTVSVTIFKYGLIEEGPSFQTEIITQSKNHKFQFNLPGGSYPKYITITFKNNGQYNLLYYFVEAGDNISLNLRKDSLIITGPKSTGFEIQYEIRQCENHFFSSGKFPHFEPATLKKNFLAIDSVANIQNSLLKQNKTQISIDLYNLLKTHIYAVWDWTEYDELIYFGMAYGDSSTNPVIDSYRNYLLKYKAPQINPNPMSNYCGFYIKYLYDKYRVDSCLAINRKFQVAACLNFFAKKYSGLLREQLFACVIAETKQYPKELREVIDNELVSMKNSDYRQFLKGVEDTRIDGATAYNFTLNDSHDKIVQLKDFKGKVVVLDFWFTGCINCKELAPYMVRIEKEFKNMPVKFVSISTDRNKDQWLSSVSNGSYTSPETANLYSGREGIKNIALQKYHVDTFPALVIVNKYGQVVNVRIDPRNDNGEALKKQITDCLNQKQLP